MWSAPAQQLVHCGQSKSLQSASLRSDCTHCEPITTKIQLQQERARITHARDIIGAHSSGDHVVKETVALGPTGHLLHKATLPRLAVITDLPNT